MSPATHVPLALAACALSCVAALWVHRRRRRAVLQPVPIAQPADRRAARSDVQGKRSRGRGALTRVNIECASTSAEYALSAEHMARRGDKVLILGGMNEGMMRDIAARTRGDGGQIIHVDMQRKDGALLSSGASASDVAHLRSVCGDVHDVLFLLGLNVPFTLIFVDLAVITGNDLILDQLAFAHTLCSIFALSCRTIIIKSRALSILAGHTIDANSFVAAVQKHTLALASPAPAAPPASAAAPAAMVAAPSTAQEAQARSPAGVDTVFIGGHGVFEYRAAALAALLPTDSVLEIGCHSGVSTRLVAQHLRSIGGRGDVVGVDIGKSIIELARSQPCAGARFEVADAWDTGALLAISSTFSVILVDVGGLSSHHGLLEALSLLRQLRSAYAPHLRLIVAKSKCMRDFPLYTRVAARKWRSEPDAFPWRRLAESVARSTAALASLSEGASGSAEPAAAASNAARSKGPAAKPKAGNSGPKVKNPARHRLANDGLPSES